LIKGRAVSLVDESATDNTSRGKVETTRLCLTARSVVCMAPLDAARHVLVTVWLASEALTFDNLIVIVRKKSHHVVT
jgi:hypothetical protein